MICRRTRIFVRNGPSPDHAHSHSHSHSHRSRTQPQPQPQPQPEPEPVQGSPRIDSDTCLRQSLTFSQGSWKCVD